MKRAKPRKKKKKTTAHNPRHASIRNVIKEDTLKLTRRSLQHHYIKIVE
jgi:hypothetical protein